MIYYVVDQIINYTPCLVALIGAEQTSLTKFRCREAQSIYGGTGWMLSHDAQGIYVLVRTNSDRKIYVNYDDAMRDFLERSGKIESRLLDQIATCREGMEQVKLFGEALKCSRETKEKATSSPPSS